MAEVNPVHLPPSPPYNSYCRFVSDGTIEYEGFKAVYDFIPNPLENIPFISKCEFEYGGSMDFIGELTWRVSQRFHCFLVVRQRQHLV